MNQKIFQIFQSQIGSKLTNSPSKAVNWLEGTLLEVSEKHVTVSYTVTENMCNPGKILHGGVASLMLDEVIGMANVISSEEYLMSSINLNVDFLSSAKIGETLTVQATLIRKGSNLNHWECVIRKDSGKIVAKATSNMLKTHVKLLDVGF
ncbi:PaaI family thioesterase [Algoriphagus namhaensis]|uniref:PaaI family thioesterase n=1 Tax=Algoriphagus namhaensis TaxID=915353 RepID=A0ABV8APV7_9BACT